MKCQLIDENCFVKKHEGFIINLSLEICRKWMITPEEAINEIYYALRLAEKKFDEARGKATTFIRTCVRNHFINKQCQNRKKQRTFSLNDYMIFEHGETENSGYGEKFHGLSGEKFHDLNAECHTDLINRIIMIDEYTQIKQILAKFPEKTQKMFAMRFFKDMTFKAIADELEGMTKQNVKAVINKTIERIQRKLNGGCIDCTQFRTKCYIKCLHEKKNPCLTCKIPTEKRK